MRVARVLILAVAILVLVPAMGLAGQIYTSGGADGYAARDWSFGFSADVNTTSQTINTWYDGTARTSGNGVLIFNLSSLAGQTLAPTQKATLRFYSFGMRGVDLKHYVGDPGFFVTESMASATGSQVSSPGTGVGWQGIDVTSFLQSAINGGWGRTAFLFVAADGGTGGLAASEDAQQRGAYLDVQPVPEPGSLLALASGLSGLAVTAIRRRRS